MPNPEQEEKNLKALLRHIKLVQDGCELLAERLNDNGEPVFSRMLIARGMKHDNSKFFGIEWENMGTDADADLLKLAIKQHVLTNDHHPEFWGGIENMPRICVAEMVADWYARAIEFGTNLREWIEEDACKKYNISMTCKTGKRIKEFVNLLLSEPFKAQKIEK